MLCSAQAAEAAVSGANRLLAQPEFRDPDKAHALMSYISDAEHIKDLPSVYSGEAGGGIKVLIGPENVAEELRDSSVVLAEYDMAGTPRASSGVVGPTRMDYPPWPPSGHDRPTPYAHFGRGSIPPPGLDNKLVIKGDSNE